MFESHGGKRALAMRLIDAVRVPLFGHRRFTAAPDFPVRRLVFICAGNICRSAFGEHVARQHGVDAISMGLYATQGSPAHPPAVTTAQALGFNMRQHQATPFSPEAVRSGDLLLAFELQHALILETALVGREASLRLLGGYLGVTDFHIHDPYGLSEAYLELCFKTIEMAVGAVVDQSRLPQVGRAPCES